MKPSSTFKFALLASSALVLAACGDNKQEVASEDALVYRTVEECVAAGQQDEAVCKQEFERAEQLHSEVAPRYTESRDCYSEHGANQCYQYRHPTSGSVWLPFMMGYMLAPRGRTFISSQPLYRRNSDSGHFYTAGNGRIGSVSADGSSRVSKSQATRPAVRTRTVGRGGFGVRATGGRGAGS